MLRTGGAEAISVLLIPRLPPLPPPWPTSREVSYAADALTETADNRLGSVPVSNATFVQPPVGRGDVTFERVPPPTETYVVGPVMYTHFSTANSSDAGFSVDLLFQHPTYAKASHRIILVLRSGTDAKYCHECICFSVSVPSQISTRSPAVARMSDRTTAPQQTIYAKA